ncbi:MAG: Ig-like domain-containing protein [Bacteroidota bacterium]
MWLTLRFCAVFLLIGGICNAQKLSQTITFDDIDPHSCVDSIFYVSARSSSNLTLSYSSSDPTIATIDQSGQVRIKKAGTVTITASQNGNATYDPATPVSHDLLATKADQVITLLSDGIDRFVFDPPFTLHFTNTSGITPNFSSSDVTVATISSTSVITILKPGNFTITATQPGNGKFNAAAPATLDLTINKKAQSITFPPIPSAGFKSTNVHSTATATSGLPLTYTSSDESIATMHDNGQVEIFQIGTVTFTAYQLGNDFYEPAIAASQSFESTKEKQTITFTQVGDKRADAPPFQFVASASSDLTVTFASIDPSVASITTDGIITVHKAGPAQINLSQDGDEEYFPAISLRMKFTVIKQTQKINGFFFIIDHQLSEDSFTLTPLTSTSGLPVTFRIVQGTVGQIRLNDNAVTMIDAGKATITAEQAGDGIYAAADPVSATFCILPDPPVLRQAIVNGETILTSSVAHNVWVRDSKVIDFTGQSYKVHDPGNYQVIANVDGCVDGYSNSVSVGDITGLEDEPTDVVVFPNPAEKNITIRCQSKAHIRITDVAGRERITQLTGENETVIDVSTLAAGIYFVIIKDSQTTRRIKFIKQ